MARDRHGEPLSEGDAVIIRGHVTRVNESQIAVEASELTSHGAASVMYLSDRQVEKCEQWVAEFDKTVSESKHSQL